MVKSLQRKFIITSMIAITVLIVMMLSALNFANMQSSHRDQERILEMVMETEGNSDRLSTPREGLPQDEFRMMKPRERQDVLRSAPYYIAWADSDGNITSMDTTHIPSLDEDTAKEIAGGVIADADGRGTVGQYRYMVQQNSDGYIIVMLDATDTRYGYLRMLGFSFVVGVGFWLLMLALVMALSRRAIRPIAENIERQKEFVTNAGHEIKTPLAIISANAEALELFQGESKWTKNIREQTKRLDGLMKDLLMLARMEEAGLTANPEDLSLNELIDEAIEAFEVRMNQKDIHLKVVLVDEVQVKVDRSQMTQAISILFDNACKYTPEGGSIDIRVEKGERGGAFSITNNCTSLPNVAPERLFERFYRADAARTQKTGGYGIGLSMAKNIANINHATISASYTRPDKITFTMNF